MLRTRVITALILLFSLLAAVFWLAPWAWATLAVILAAAAAWEWATLLGRTTAVRIAYVLAISMVTTLILVSDAVAATSGALLLIVVSVSFWCLVVPVWLAKKWPIASSAGFLVGFVLIVPTVLALVLLRTISPGFLLAAMAVVWVADIAAYFVGRAFGKHKMAPHISPGKSWEGAAGGLVGVLLYGFIAVRMAGHELNPDSAGVFATVLLVIATLSILGDLFESLAKRQIGVKDSGRLLPGHGGLLDRIDSLTATLPAIALISVTPFLHAKLGL